jgi:dolichol kinase
VSLLQSSRVLLQQYFPVSPQITPDTPLPRFMLSVPGVSRLVERLGIIEFRRRLFHMSPSLIPIGLPYIPHSDVWDPLLVLGIVLCVIGGLAIAMTYRPLFTRSGEQSWMRAVLGYITPIVGALILFPGRAELGLMTLQIVALGDGFATLGGILLGGKRLPWNREKTFAGFICFIIVGSSTASYNYWGEAHPVVPYHTAYLVCFVAAFCAAIVESLPIRSNDNLRVGMTALLSGTLATFILT